MILSNFTSPIETTFNIYKIAGDRHFQPCSFPKFLSVLKSPLLENAIFELWLSRSPTFTSSSQIGTQPFGFVVLMTHCRRDIVLSLNFVAKSKHRTPCKHHREVSCVHSFIFIVFYHRYCRFPLPWRASVYLWNTRSESQTHESAQLLKRN